MRPRRRPDPIPIGFVGVLLIVALIPLLSLLPRDADVLLDAEAPAGLATALAEAHAGLRIESDVAAEILPPFQSDGPFTMMDATVAARLEALGRRGSFTPLTSSTVVVAYDPERVDPDDLGYLTDYGRLEAPLFVPGGDTSYRVVATLAGALGGARPEPASHDAAMALLKSVRQGPGLVIGRPWREYPDHFAEAPAALLTDAQAVELRAEGLPIEFFVPHDANLTWIDGLWSNNPGAPAPQVAPETLAAHGLRAADGTADPALFPPVEDYAGTRGLVTVSDRDRLDRLYTNMWRDIRRTVLGTHFHTPATGRERLALTAVLSVLLLLWGASLIWRARSAQQGRLLQALAFTMVSWLFIRVLKEYALGPAYRLLWYGFLPSMLAMTAIFALLARHVAEPGRRRPHTGRIVAWGSVLLALLVVTNDLHQWVYALHSTSAGADDHDYGPGFYAVSAWIVGWVLYTVVVLLRSAGRMRNWAALGVAVATLGFLATYQVAYSARVPVFRQTETTLITIVAVIILVEAFTRSGLIPANRRYLELFQATTVPAALYDARFRRIDSSPSAGPLPDPVRAELAAGATLVKHRPPDGGATDYHRVPIDGGHVVWGTDMGPLVLARTRLAGTKAALDRRLALLRRAAAADGDRRKLAYGNRVLQRLQDTVDERLADVAAVGKRLAEEPAGAPVATDGDAPCAATLRARRNNDLRHVGLALTYCKRAGLAILEAAATPLDADRLAEDLRMLCASFATAEYRAAADGSDPLVDAAGVVTRGSGPLPTATYLAALNVIHRLLDDAVQHAPMGLAGFLTVVVDRRSVRVTVLWEGTSGALDGDGLLRSTRLIADAPGLADTVTLLRADATADGPGTRLTVELGVRT